MSILLFYVWNCVMVVCVDVVLFIVNAVQPREFMWPFLTFLML